MYVDCMLTVMLIVMVIVMAMIIEAGPKVTLQRLALAEALILVACIGIMCDGARIRAVCEGLVRVAWDSHQHAKITQRQQQRQQHR